MKLILAEKQDQAKKIAEAMGWRSGNGCFVGQLEGEAATVVWARGHLFALKTPDEIDPTLGWNEPHRLLPITQRFVRKLSVASKFLAPIKAQIKTASELIIATDSDREGEAIGWEIAEELRYRGPVRRLWLAAGLDKKSIVEAVAKLRPPEITKSWYRASEARNRADWGYMLAVRCYTFYASYGKFGQYLGRGASAKARVMSVGRVQTPALGMIVRRDWLIDNFISKDHFKIFGIFNGEQTPMRAQYAPRVTAAIIDAQPVGVEWEPPKAMPKDGQPDPLEVPLYTGKAEVEAFATRLREHALATVSAYTESTRKENPPKTFSLADAQIAIGKAIGLSAGLVQTLLEDLYEQGWISYARTSKADLPKNLYATAERNSLLSSVFGLREVGEQARRAAAIHNGLDAQVQAFLPAVFTDKNLEHHGIVPTPQVMTEARLAALAPKKSRGYHSEQMKKAYLMVAKQFIQALYPAARYSVQKARFTLPCVDMLGNEVSVFQAKGERLVDAGWRAAFTASMQKDSTLPRLQTGTTINLQEVLLDAAKTQPPKRYTEANFPKAMESIGREVTDLALRKRLKDSDGIGTPATRKTIVETLLARDYIQVRQGSYYSTAKGKELIAQVPQWLASAETTALWEDCLVKICQQRDDVKATLMRDQFVGKSIQRLEALIEEMNSQHSDNLGAKVAQAKGSYGRAKSQPGGRSKSTRRQGASEGGNTVANKPTAKMISAAKSVAARKGLTLIAEATTSFDACKQFLDSHPYDSGANSAPTDKQINFAQSLLKSAPKDFEVPADWQKNRAVCSQVISQLAGR